MWFSRSRTIACNSYSRNVVWFTDQTFVWTQDKTRKGNINFQRLKNFITFGWWIDDGPEDIFASAPILLTLKLFFFEGQLTYDNSYHYFFHCF